MWVHRWGTSRSEHRLHRTPSAVYSVAITACEVEVHPSVAQNIIGGFHSREDVNRLKFRVDLNYSFQKADTSNINSVKGKKAIQNQPYDRHPCIGLTEQNITTVRGFIKRNRHLNVETFALKFGIRYGSNGEPLLLMS